MLAQQGVDVGSLTVYGKEPPFPENYSHIVALFHQLHNSRTYGLHVANPITFSEIYAWQQLHHKLHSWEVAALQKMDQHFLNTQQNSS